MRTPWEQPVMLACKKTGHFFVITSTEEAFEMLTSNWPVVDGKAFATALEACSMIILDRVDRTIARAAFVEAAIEADLSLQSIQALPSFVMS